MQKSLKVLSKLGQIELDAGSCYLVWKKNNSNVVFSKEKFEIPTQEVEGLQ